MPHADAYVAGIGETEYSRRSGRSVQSLAIEAAHALSDAALPADRLDGIIPVGGSIFTEDLIVGLGLPPKTFDALAAPDGNSAPIVITRPVTSETCSPLQVAKFVQIRLSSGMKVEMPTPLLAMCICYSLLKGDRRESGYCQGRFTLSEQLPSGGFPECN
jgi:hypothetical protein